MKLFIFALPVILAACSTNPPLPTATGKAVPVNSVNTLEYLAHEAGKVIVGPQRHEPEVRNRLLLRPVDQGTLTHVNNGKPGGELVQRTVVVPFDYNSAEFKPTGDVVYRLMQLSAIADRVEIRGRTDALINSPGNQEMARRRAIAARDYLIQTVGLRSEHIAVNYRASGDRIHSIKGAPRRVELEFIIDDFSQVKRNSCKTSRPSSALECGL